jgi:D-alanyl-D-alanine carboxypeptidase
MLLDHTSGLSDYFENPLIDRLLQGRPDLVWTPAMALKYVRAPYFKPGTAWHYSNTNYLLLGLIAERVTGQSLDEELRERFLDPLRLDHTWYQVAESPETAIAHGYRLLNSGAATKALDLTRSSDVMPFRSVLTAAGGAGSIAATSGDLAVWAEALYSGKVLPESAFRLMVDDVARTVRYKPRLPYGLGVQAPKIESWPTLGHSGRLLGFRGAVRYVTTAGITIAVLTNQSRVDVSPLVRRLLRIILAPKPAPHATSSGPVTSPSATP